MNYLMRRNGCYYFRVRVPKELLAAFGRREIKKALKARNLQDAKTRVKVLTYRVEKLYTQIRSSLMTEEEIETLIRNFLGETLKRFEDDRLRGVGIPRDENQLQKLVRAYDIMKEEDTKGLAFGRYEGIEAWLHDELRSKDVQIERGTHEYKKLCRRMLEARSRFWEIEKQRMQGNYDNEYDRQALHPAAIGRPADAPQRVKTLSALMEMYETEKTVRKEWRHKTWLENKGIFRLALAILGDVDVKTLDREAFVGFSSTLAKLPPKLRLEDAPPYRSKNPQYKGRTIPEVLKMIEQSEMSTHKKGPVLAVKTFNKAVQGVSTLMDWAVKQGIVDRNYAVGLAARDSGRRSEKRKVFATEDLQSLVDSPCYTTDIPFTKPERFWIPLIALFTGARLNEICSLYVGDIQTIDDIPCFNINQDMPDKSIKTDSSARVVPIHPNLIDIGFLGYVETQKVAGCDRLWPNLTHTKNNGYGGAFGQWCGRYVRAHVTRDPKKVFHSFRHTLINNLKQQEVDQRVIEAIDGHQDTSMSGGLYGKDYKPAILLNALTKLDYGISFERVKWNGRANSLPE